MYVRVIPPDHSLAVGTGGTVGFKYSQVEMAYRWRPPPRLGTIDDQTDGKLFERSSGCITANLSGALLATSIWRKREGKASCSGDWEGHKE